MASKTPRRPKIDREQVVDDAHAKFIEQMESGAEDYKFLAISKLKELIEAGNLGAIKFYLTCCCGWKETKTVDHTSSDGTMSPNRPIDPSLFAPEQLAALRGLEVA